MVVRILFFSYTIMLGTIGLQMVIPAEGISPFKLIAQLSPNFESKFEEMKNKFTAFFPGGDGHSKQIGAGEGDESFIANVDKDNWAAYSILMQLVDSDSGWSFVAEKLGVKVYRRSLEAGSFVNAEDAAKGGKHACVKSSAILNAHPEAVFQLFADNSRVNEYNEHCAVLYDVRQLPGGHSKVSYAATPSYGPFKARELVSVVNYNKHPNGSFVILNRPAYLSSQKPNNKYVRATVLLGGNVIRPHGPHRNQTHLTLIAQVNPGGVSDTPAAAWIINKLCAAGPPKFIRDLEKAAQTGGKVRSSPWDSLPLPRNPLEAAKEFQQGLASKLQHFTDQSHSRSSQNKFKPDFKFPAIR